MSIFMRLSVVLFVLMLFGCAGQSARREDASLIDEAQGRIRAGDYEGAARVYQHLSETSTAPDYYRLMAADAELRGGNGAAAQALLGQVRADDLIDDEQYRYTLLKSRLYLNQGRAREAMALLDTLSPQQLDPGLRAHYHTLRASAYNQLGNMLESARERIFLGYLLRSPEAIQKNNEAIYDDLSRMPEAALSGLKPARRDTLGGWMELVEILKGPGAERSREVQAWRDAIPRTSCKRAVPGFVRGQGRGNHQDYTAAGRDADGSARGNGGTRGDGGNPARRCPRRRPVALERLFRSRRPGHTRRYRGGP